MFAMLLQRQTVDGMDNGPRVVVPTLVMLTVAILAALTKIVTKLTMAGKLALDDLYITLASLCSIGYSVALVYEQHAGLGRSIETLSAQDIANYGKAQYTTDFFYVLSLGLAQWALMEFLFTLARRPKQMLITRCILYFTGLKTLAALLTVAFQCNVPQTWNTLEGRCISRFGFWTAYGILDIFIDIATIALPVYLLRDLKVKSGKRWGAIIAFMTRIIVVPAIVIRIVFLSEADKSSDKSFSEWKPAIITSVHVVISILTTCLPFFKPVMKGMQSGVFNADMNGTRMSPGNSYNLSNRRPGDNIRPKLSHLPSTQSNIRSTNSKADRPPSRDSNERLIYKQTEFTVDYEESVQTLQPPKETFLRN